MSVTESKKSRSLTPASQPNPTEPSKSSTNIDGGVEPLPDKHAVARHLKVSVRTVDRMVATRKLPFILLGERMIRFRWADVERAINRMIVKEVK
jgi:excisionase family DNA binding protein